MQCRSPGRYGQKCCRKLVIRYLMKIEMSCSIAFLADEDALFSECEMGRVPDTGRLL